MKIKSQKDFWSGLMFISLGIGFAWGATAYHFGAAARPGPGYFPFGLGILLALLGAILLFTALTIETEGGDPIGKVVWRPLLTIVFAVALFGALLPHLGMVLSLPILIVVSASASDEFRLKEALINSIILTAASYGIFIYGLQLTIPLWPSMFS